jgi:hypothetical protein
VSDQIYKAQDNGSGCVIQSKWGGRRIHVGVAMQGRVEVRCVVLSNGKGLHERVGMWSMVHYIPCPHPYVLILKLVTVTCFQVLEGLQHMAPLNSESWNPHQHWVKKVKNSKSVSMFSVKKILYYNWQSVTDICRGFYSLRKNSSAQCHSK